MDYKILEVRDLWTLIKNGDIKAQDELVRRFDALIASQSKVEGRIDEDVVQDVRLAFLSAVLSAIRGDRTNDIL